MPIDVGAQIRRLDDEEFKARVYEVMRHVFDIHNELGRLFHEKVYQWELAFRVPDAEREVPVRVWCDDFCKEYYLDLLVGRGAIFEMKALESLAKKHERQLMQYLFLTELPHGKLINLRPERVEHRFVNNTLTLADRTSFVLADAGWQEIESMHLKERMTAALRDWGTGLDLGLYEELAAHLCGRPPDAETDVEIRLGTRSLGCQRVRLASPGIAIKVTALPAQRYSQYHTDLRVLLEHTDLRAIQWINITRAVVQFRTVWGKRK